MFDKFRAPKDTGVILKEAAHRLDLPTRRLFLRNAIGLGSLTLLSGCDVVDGFSAERVLQSMSDFNDRVQALLFDPNKLAPEYPESAITRPFPFNAFYTEDKAPDIDPIDFRLDITGLAENQNPWTLEGSMRCRGLPRSRGTSASKVGARSANGRVFASQIFWRGLAPI